MALAVKRGELSRRDVSETVCRLADSLSVKKLREFAATKHAGLPGHVPQELPAASRGLAVTSRAARAAANGILMTIGSVNPREPHEPREYIGYFSVGDVVRFGGKTYEVFTNEIVNGKIIVRPLGDDDDRPLLPARVEDVQLVSRGNPKKRGCVRKNEGTGYGQRYKEYTVPLGDFPAIPGLDKAIARYEEFHQAKPTRVRIFEYEDGNDIEDVRVCFRMGKAHVKIDTVEDTDGNEVRIKPLEIGMVYSVDKKSGGNKAGIQWVHTHKEEGGVPPIHVVDIDTGIVSQLGGSYEVRDWVRQ